MSTTLEYRPSVGLGARPEVFPMLEIYADKPVSNPDRISWSRPYAWSTIIPAVRRQESIEGALIGCALGESFARLSSSARKRIFGSTQPVDPGRLVPSHRTEGMLVTVQAVLLSQAMSEQFVASLTQRLRWYQRFQPIACAKYWIGSLVGPDRFGARLGDDPLMRALVLSVIMQGHHDGALDWIQESTQISYANRWVTQASFLVATATQIAQFQRTAHQASVSGLLEDLKAATGSKEIENRIDALIDAKSQNQSVLQASKILSGKDRWQDHLVENALLAIYGYVRYPDRIEEGLRDLSQLRGDLRGVMPIYAALATVHSSVGKIPSRWVERLSLYPYSNQWVQQYVDRCADWPHGPEDIQATRCLPSHLTGQWIRNLLRGFS
ncbi:MAG: ADP-ribosylglycohydrolase family protein [Pirellula sp.]